jgi:hypothetical protein
VDSREFRAGTDSQHELAPSFINQMSGGRRPRWLPKGIAQARPEEPGGRGQRVQQVFAVQQEIPFNALEADFIQFSAREAIFA